MFLIFRKNLLLVLPTLAIMVALVVAQYARSEYNFAHPQYYTGKGGGDGRDLEQSLCVLALALALALLLFLSSRWLIVRLVFYLVAFVAAGCLLLAGFLLGSIPPGKPSINPDGPPDYLWQLSLGSYVALLLLACFRRQP